MHTKLQFLENLLLSIRSSSNDKIVIVSNFTSTLDNIEIFMQAKGYSFLRLDGSTAVKDRTGLVKTFNESKECFAFLLSSKAGGVGLNLIGANRLVLLDPDWNPANDQQALARVWRPGQINPVYIYRLVGARTIEEKILQRQAYKATLAQEFVDMQASSVRCYVRGDIRKLLSCELAGTAPRNVCRHSGPYSVDEPDQSCVVEPHSHANGSPPPSWIEGFCLPFFDDLDRLELLVRLN
ncbi:putative DNA repair and recombination protein RAD54 [Toxoplasma gondii TgCatPRC2]|uniref:DNA repair and recombination protein RAD54 n=12 Tax=Toxoplasma gondii TaxID=5811 RepID=A0A125YGP9_TOXGV|nr:DNA repair and recombination protein RAD54, putative [Toxoplasma gondii ME49]EPR61432.1 putative DNA repair and recombination protein RAD54 [Toxoplasma gondii GT1]ESS33225.1 putative DNA repair and recombination protein RAD54 [Toxoplasma gondii VEG]KAF4642687.1 putative DNA repair and recombination protein RAD54 [Toxoplasma gondii]KFG33663.1 putative DNA repair and recombination protein RAD54 [Toxoplasma gondii p89]KFG36830.1 putative DNA repair and recombination protein RAD54 [Toxoplasma g|eukprot:XP_018637275.1 DNA repair and recombination protein RAD54, putative [Toxoplasma gondii ME49]